MKIYKKKLVMRKRVKHIVCNKCGENIKINEYMDFLSIVKNWEYNSNYDNEIHRFDICQDCYKKFISNFEIEPKITKRKNILEYNKH